MAMAIFVTKQNTDLTEGKGPMIPVGYFAEESDAVEFAKGRGVMGVGDGEVYEITVWDSLDEIGPLSSTYVKATKDRMVYGYHQTWRGTWGYGYVDDRDDPKPTHDPEYQEYLRLKDKFE